MWCRSPWTRNFGHVSSIDYVTSENGPQTSNNPNEKSMSGTVLSKQLKQRGFLQKARKTSSKWVFFVPNINGPNPAWIQGKPAQKRLPKGSLPDIRTHFPKMRTTWDPQTYLSNSPGHSSQETFLFSLISFSSRFRVLTELASFMFRESSAYQFWQGFVAALRDF